MRLKRYTAKTMAEGLALVRKELGPDALVLSSRTLRGGVELLAAVEQADWVPEPAVTNALAYHGVPAELMQTLRADTLEAALTQALAFAPLPLAPHGRPVLVVGPPGAGKTLTVARLTTRLVLGGTPPLVITCDGKRAGAAEQLAAFTRVLGLQLLAASTPGALMQGLTRRAEGAPVLIDSAGCTPFDPEAAGELRELIEAAGAVPVLALPAGLDPLEAAELAAGFAALGAGLMVATRMDVARRLGGILAAAFAGPLALAEAGVGPGAADGLIPLTAAALAARLMQTPEHERRNARGE